MAHQRTRLIRRGTRRATFWAGSAIDTAPSAVAAATTIHDQTLIGTDDPETVVRTRGIFTVETDQTTAAEFPFGAIGMAVVNNQAVSVGPTAFPSPYTDSDSDLWFLHQFWAAPVRIGTDATGIYRAAYQVEFDSKAMRRLTGDESIVVVVENGSAANGAQYNLSFRMLLKVS